MRRPKPRILVLGSHARNSFRPWTRNLGHCKTYRSLRDEIWKMAWKFLNNMVLFQHPYFEKNYQEVLWGDNYERLLKINKKAGSYDTFWCHPCLGTRDG